MYNSDEIQYPTIPSINLPLIVPTEPNPLPNFDSIFAVSKVAYSSSYIFT